MPTNLIKYRPEPTVLIKDNERTPLTSILNFVTGKENKAYFRTPTGYLLVKCDFGSFCVLVWTAVSTAL
jgi:hypothetical protein